MSGAGGGSVGGSDNPGGAGGTGGTDNKSVYQSPYSWWGQQSPGMTVSKSPQMGQGGWGSWGGWSGGWGEPWYSPTGNMK